MAITNLTGYTWVGNETVDIQSMVGIHTTTTEKKFNVNVVWNSGSETFEKDIFKFAYVKNFLGYIIALDDIGLYNTVAPGWLYEYPLGATIEITGGDDVTNTELISWLEANGTLTKAVPDFTETKTALKVYEDLTEKEYNAITKEPNSFYLVNDVGVYKGNKLIATYLDKYNLETSLSNKQDTLVSGDNIKTINGESLLGSGNINVEGGGGSGSGANNFEYIEVAITETDGVSTFTLTQDQYNILLKNKGVGIKIGEMPNLYIHNIEFFEDETGNIVEIIELAADGKVDDVSLSITAKNSIQDLLTFIMETKQNIHSNSHYAVFDFKNKGIKSITSLGGEIVDFEGLVINSEIITFLKEVGKNNKIPILKNILIYDTHSQANGKIIEKIIPYNVEATFEEGAEGGQAFVAGSFKCWISYISLHSGNEANNVITKISIDYIAQNDEPLLNMTTIANIESVFTYSEV